MHTKEWVCEALITQQGTYGMYGFCGGMHIAAPTQNCSERQGSGARDVRARPVYVCELALHAVSCK